MANYQDHSLTAELSRLLTYLREPRFHLAGIHHSWIYRFNPHIDCELVGDSPHMMIVFRESRVNPPRDSERPSVQHQVMVLNWSMMTAWRELIDASGSST